MPDSQSGDTSPITRKKRAGGTPSKRRKGKTPNPERSWHLGAGNDVTENERVKVVKVAQKRKVAFQSHSHTPSKKGPSTTGVGEELTLEVLVSIVTMAPRHCDNDFHFVTNVSHFPVYHHHRRSKAVPPRQKAVAMTLRERFSLRYNGLQDPYN